MKSNKTFIIAEAGVNHNGSLKRAFKMVDVAKRAGADAVKFQSFRTSNISTTKASLADYQKNKLFKSQYALLKKLELSYKKQKKIKQYCEKKKYNFLIKRFRYRKFKILKILKIKNF